MTEYNHTAKFTVSMTLEEMHNILAGELCEVLAKHTKDEDECDMLPEAVLITDTDEERKDVIRMQRAYMRLVRAAQECDLVFHELFDCR